MKLLLALTLSAGASTTAAASPLDIEGLWLTEAGTARVEITDCGDASPCGTLVWVDPAAGGPGIDARNPDPDLRQRPLVGIALLSGFEQRNNAWRGGRIYSPEEGRTVGAVLTPLDDGALQVRGCFGPICRTQVWTRIDHGDTAD